MSVWQSEPVRTALYPILALIVGFAAARGLIDNETAVFVASLGALILGAAGVEVARSQVTPVAAAFDPVPSEADLASVSDAGETTIGNEGTLS